MREIISLRTDKVLERQRHLYSVRTKRNRMARQMRLQLKDLLDILGDSKVEPPLPKYLLHWMKKEVKKI